MQRMRHIPGLRCTEKVATSPGSRLSSAKTWGCSEGLPIHAGATSKALSLGEVRKETAMASAKL